VLVGLPVVRILRLRGTEGGISEEGVVPPLSLFAAGLGFFFENPHLGVPCGNGFCSVRSMTPITYNQLFDSCPTPSSPANTVRRSSPR
jgi:hypothetical protein